MKSYLTNRKQYVKLGSIKSDFETILKGEPQGSILGSVLFNIFINVIFHFIESCSLYNYADDNTVSDKSLEYVIPKLSEVIVLLIRWFLNNMMQVSPKKIQAIAVGEKIKIEDINFNLDNNMMKCEENIKLLGVTIDFQLTFNDHVSNIHVCKRASKQLNVLKQIGKH